MKVFITDTTIANCHEKGVRKCINELVCDALGFESINAENLGAAVEIAFEIAHETYGHKNVDAWSD